MFSMYFLFIIKLQGKVKVSGNMGLAMKLVDLQRTAQHRIEELKIKHKL